MSQHAIALPRHRLAEAWTTFTGLRSVLEQLPRLLALARLCGQAHFVSELQLFLTAPKLEGQAAQAVPARTLPAASLKVPKLVCKVDSGSFLYAVLLYEYRIYGIATGVFVPGDLEGWRTVIAPEEERGRAAAEAAEFLLTDGANIVMANYAECAIHSQPRSGIESPQLLGSRTREARRVLPLEASFDATLAPMGAHTRRNLRASQRRVIKELGAEYYASAELNLPLFLAANQACVYTVPAWTAEWRYRTARSRADGIFAGLRDARGQWLSLLGGYRSHGTVFVEWQMNLQSSGALSLGTAIRAFFIADEVERGMQWIRFEGGTSHAMNAAFLKERVHELMFARRGLARRPLVRALLRVMPATGVLAEAILSEEFVWSRAASTA